MGNEEEIVASLYRIALEQWLKTISVDAPVIIDVAAGDRPAMGRIKSCKYKEYYTVDKEKQYRPNLWHDMNYFKDYTKTPWQKQADVIFCLELAEYLWNPVNAIFTLNNWLRVGGTLYMSFPFIYPHHEPVQHDYLRYTRQWIERVLVEQWNQSPRATWSDYELLPRYATQGKRHLENFYAAERMHASSNVPQDITGWLLRARK